MNTYINENESRNRLKIDFDKHMKNQNIKNSYIEASKTRLRDSSTVKINTLNSDINSVLNSLLYVNKHHKFDIDSKNSVYEDTNNITFNYDFTSFLIPDVMKEKPLNLADLKASISMMTKEESINKIKTNIVYVLLNDCLEKTIDYNKIVNMIYKLYDFKFESKYIEYVRLLVETSEVYFEHSLKVLQIVADVGLHMVNMFLDKFTKFEDLETFFGKDTSITFSTKNVILYENLIKKQSNGLLIYDDSNIIPSMKQIILKLYQNFVLSLLVLTKLAIINDGNKNNEEHVDMSFEIYSKDLQQIFTHGMQNIETLNRNISIKFITKESQLENLCKFCNEYITNKTYKGSIFDYTSNVENLISVIHLLDKFNHKYSEITCLCIGYLKPDIHFPTYEVEHDDVNDNVEHNTYNGSNIYNKNNKYNNNVRNKNKYMQPYTQHNNNYIQRIRGNSIQQQNTSIVKILILYLLILVLIIILLTIIMKARNHHQRIKESESIPINNLIHLKEHFEYYGLMKKSKH